MATSNTLSKITYRVAAELGIVLDCVASAGGTTSATDTTNLTHDADYWNYGTIWITYDAGGLGAAPEWENKVITDFASGVVTFGAMTSAVGAGDTFSVAKRRYPYGILKQKVNQAIRELGDIEVTDTSTVTIAAGKTEYSLPDIANLDLREAWIQGQTSDETNDNRWRRLDGWYIQKSATGTANILVLPQYATGYDLKLVYAGLHADLTTATSEIDDSVHQNKVIFQAAVDCLVWRKQKVGDDDGEIAQQLNYFSNKLEEAKQMYPNPIPSPKPKLLVPLGVGMGGRFRTIDEL
jgi:hypothetical protein